MDEQSARAILAWRYGPPYHGYSAGPSKGEDIQGLLDPRNAYYTVQNDQEEFIGFRRFGPNVLAPGAHYSAEVLDTGGGMRSDLTGRGMGLGVLMAGLAFGRTMFGHMAF